MLPCCAIGAHGLVNGRAEKMSSLVRRIIESVSVEIIASFLESFMDFMINYSNYILYKTFLYGFFINSSNFL
jgi:hypothetical protein